jgi:hypothetical protein
MDLLEISCLLDVFLPFTPSAPFIAAKITGRFFSPCRPPFIAERCLKSTLRHRRRDS